MPLHIGPASEAPAGRVQALARRPYSRRLLTRAAIAASAAALAGTVLAVPAGPAAAARGTAASVSFTAVGEHAFPVPVGVSSIHVVAIGAAGGGNALLDGGEGARVEGDIAVAPGEVLYIEVGGDGADATTAKATTAAGGSNGGGSGGGWYGGNTAAQVGATLNLAPQSGAGGGGASDIQTCPAATCQAINHGSSSILLVAGGGGGAAGSFPGDAGTPNGHDASPVASSLTTNIAGEGLGASTTTQHGNSTLGTTGCEVCNAGLSGDTLGAGGGGGGYYAGGGGVGGDATTNFLGGAGGGGSSYGPAGTTYTTTSAGPSVTIRYATEFKIRAVSDELPLESVNFGAYQEFADGSPNEAWEFVPSGAYYLIRNYSTGYCLGTDGLAGDQLYVSTCSVSQDTEWVINSYAGYGTAIYWFTSLGGLRAEVKGNSYSAGAAIDAAPFNGGYGNQYFTIVTA